MPAAGWAPWHLALYEAGRLVAAAPCYLKGNSHGEFVFDGRWAEAHSRLHAQRSSARGYYPKLLVAVPYTPATGPRLLAPSGPRQRELRRALLEALRIECLRHGLSGAHVNFLSEDEAASATEDPWIPRSDWQFHWTRAGEQDFDDLLARMQHKARKNIRQERRKLAGVGLEFEWRRGEELDEGSWQEVHRLYRDTFERKFNHPALTAAFFPAVARALPGSCLVALVRRHGAIVAMALYWRNLGTLWGRYWGSRIEVPGLHFETCYYRGLEYCLAHGLQRFEPGAQGEHKLARGFLPARTRSTHFLADPSFRALIRRHLAHEAVAMNVYHAELLRHVPFKAGS
jgi:predicted N-acyltransferase